MSGRQVARAAKAKSGSQDTSRRHGPNGLSNLISAPRAVVPGGLPHLYPAGQSGGDIQFVAEVEPGDQHRQSSDRHSRTVSGHGVCRKKNARHDQRRTEILLQEEERQRRSNTHRDRDHVLDARQIQPAGNTNLPNRLTANLPQQFPSSSEVPGEEQCEQQAYRFDWLNRSEIHLRVAASWAAAEKNQQAAQEKSTNQGDIAELQECGLAEVDERHHGKCHEAQGDALRVPDEQRGVAQGIGPAHDHREADSREEMPGAEQQVIASKTSHPPEERHHPDGSKIDTRPEQHQAPEGAGRSHHECRLERRKMAGVEKRQRGRTRARRRVGTIECLPQALLVIQKRRALDDISRDRRAKDGADVRQTVSPAAH